MSLPTLFGTGRLTADPELRFSPQGVAVCTVSLAFNSRKQVNGEWVDGDVMFISGTLFKQAAENASESLSKGDEVVISGRLRTERWENREGEKRSAVKLMVDSIAPSLRFAVARVEKQERGKPQGSWGAPSKGFQSAEAPPF